MKFAGFQRTDQFDHPAFRGTYLLCHMHQQMRFDNVPVSEAGGLEEPFVTRCFEQVLATTSTSTPSEMLGIETSTPRFGRDVLN